MDGAKQEQRWYTIRDAAALLGLSRQTLWRRIREGTLEPLRVDGRLVIPRSLLIRLQTESVITVRPYRVRRPKEPQ